MAKPKNPLNKSTSENLQEKLDAARAKRLAIHNKTKKQNRSDVEIREEFRKYWTVAKKEFNRGKELEEVLWAYLVSIGFNKPELFEKGIKQFGLKKVGEK